MDPKGHENIIELALYNLKKQSDRARGKHDKEYENVINIWDFP